MFWLAEKAPTEYREWIELEDSLKVVLGKK
jgi:hypothetical protein